MLASSCFEAKVLALVGRDTKILSSALSTFVRIWLTLYHHADVRICIQHTSSAWAARDGWLVADSPLTDVWLHATGQGATDSRRQAS